MKDKSFVKLSELYFSEPELLKLPLSARVLHAMLVDRLSLAEKMGWADRDGRIYVTLAHKDAARKLGVSRPKVTKLFRLLEERGLIERRRRGQGKCDMIFVRPLMNIKRCGNGCARVPEVEHQEVQKGDIPLLHQTVTRGFSDSVYPSDRGLIRGKIRDNIDYSWFMEAYENSDPRTRPEGSPGELEEIVELMVDVICSGAETFKINGGQVSAEAVREQLMRLNSEHIQYVFHRLHDSGGPVRNVRGYLLTALYNAAMTMESGTALEVYADRRGR